MSRFEHFRSLINWHIVTIQSRLKVGGYTLTCFFLIIVNRKYTCNQNHVVSHNLQSWPFLWWRLKQQAWIGLCGQHSVRIFFKMDWFSISVCFISIVIINSHSNSITWVKGPCYGLCYLSLTVICGVYKTCY